MEMSAQVPTRFRLQEILDGLSLSQRELARLSGVSPTTINRMCANLTAQVSLATLDALAKQLKVEPGDLIERKGAKKRRRK